MQATKDSFYMTLRSRLQESNPQRTAVIGGVVRPAVMVLENERPGEDAEMNETFCLTWGSPKVAEPGGRLQMIACEVSYQSKGTDAAAGTDRGRALGVLDMELAQICSSQSANKMDYTKTPAAALGSSLFWSAPVFAEPEVDGQTIRRKAIITIYSIPEGA